MAMKTDQIKLPVSVATEIVNKAKDTSTIASLSPSTPQIFSDADYLVFNGKSEAEAPANSSGPTRTTSCRSSAASRPIRQPHWAAPSTT